MGHLYIVMLLKALLFTSTVLSLSPKSEDLAQSQAGKNYNLMGYYQSQTSTVKSARIDVDQISPKLSHILFAFVVVDPKQSKCIIIDEQQDTKATTDSNLSKLNAKTNCDGNNRAAGNLAALYALKMENPHQKVLLSVGGASKEKTENFAKATATSDGIKSLAKSCTQIALDYGFDGIDYDWESPTSQKEWDAYAELIKSSRDEFDKLPDKSRYLVLVTILQNVFTDKSDDAFKKISKLVNLVNLMTYDSSYGSDSALHDAAIHSTELSYDTPYLESTVKSALKYFQPEHIMVGRPLYGYQTRVRFENTPINANLPGLYGKVFLDNTTTLTYNQIRDDYVNNKEYTRYWDDSAKAAYLYNQKTKTFITYTDDQSIDETINYIKGNNLAGLFFWHLGGSYNFQNKKEELIEFAATKLPIDKAFKKVCANHSPFCNIKTQCTEKELNEVITTSSATTFNISTSLLTFVVIVGLSLW